MNVFLSRPAEDVAERPIDEILKEIPDTTDHLPSA